MAKRGSKRQALRFRAEGHKLRYKTEYEDCTAVLVNISVNGCAVSDYSVNMEIGEKILLIVPVEEQEIEIGAEVVRKENSSLAVKFIDISEKNQQSIIKYFAKKQRTNT